MIRLLLPLSLILLFSCKGKEKPAPCEGHLIIVHGSKMPDSLHCGDTIEFIVPKKDSLAYWEYAEQGYGGGIASWSQDDSIKSSIDSSSFGPVTYGFKRMHHKKKPAIDTSQTIQSFPGYKLSADRNLAIPDISPDTNNIAHDTARRKRIPTIYMKSGDYRIIPAGTDIVSSPYFQITSWGITDVSDSGRIVAIRDSSGHWDIKDPARALEVMYKIVWKKDR